MTTAVEDDWVELAERDDHLVAEMLLRLRRAASPFRKSAPGLALPLEWRVRQPRSGGPKEKENKRRKKNEQEAVEPARASPTTPLSWSCATSTSGGGCGADGPEESSRPAGPPCNARSKVSIFSATASSTTPATRRAKRKMTLAELKEEESLLLKERRNLRHQLAALRLTLEQERAQNEILKQKKLDLQLQHAKTIAARNMTADHEPLEVPHKSRDNINVVCPHPPTDIVSTPSKAERCEMMFELPDLNIPVEEQCGP